jgi:DeoR/GlpR family transcriptional regulator of sugar metabolism
MLASLRHQRILESLSIEREITVAGLARSFGCSLETIRRDLALLERRRQLSRVHGGAVQVPSPDLPPVPTRMGRERAAKEHVAELAAAQVPAGAHVFLGAGTTTLALAVRLVSIPARTVFVTNMLDIAQVLGHGDHEVHLTGGVFHPETHALGGPEVLQFLDGRLFDLTILGAAAFDREHGVMGPTAAHAALVEHLRPRSRRRMVVADSSKFGRSDRYVLLGFADIDLMVTDRPPAEAFLERFARAGTQVLWSERAA